MKAARVILMRHGEVDTQEHFSEAVLTEGGIAQIRAALPVVVAQVDRASLQEIFCSPVLSTIQSACQVLLAEKEGEIDYITIGMIHTQDLLENEHLFAELAEWLQGVDFLSPTPLMVTHVEQMCRFPQYFAEKAWGKLIIRPPEWRAEFASIVVLDLEAQEVCYL